MSVKIYFSGSIRGGRELQPRYKAIIDALKAEGHEVLSEHVGQEGLTEKLPPFDIYVRDMIWLLRSDVVIADVTIPSLGVGFEVGTAVHMQKPTLCIAEEKVAVSAMIVGCSFLDTYQYRHTDEAIKAAVDWVKSSPKWRGVGY